MASPGPYSNDRGIEAKRTALLDLARMYAHGAASEEDVARAARDYSKAVDDAPARARHKEQGA